jgi:nucleotide-binding universal stress UspA family protein
MDTIVVGIDFSENSRDAVAFARGLVQNHGRLHLVHVVTDGLQAPWMAEAGADFVRLQQEWRVEAEQRLIAFAADLELDPLRTTTVVANGRTDEEVVRYARDQGADAIVLGSHGHGPIRHFLLGSATERVLRHASCPVVVVPHRSLRGGLPAAHAEVRVRS